MGERTIFRIPEDKHILLLGTPPPHPLRCLTGLLQSSALDWVPSSSDGTRA